MNTKVLWSYHEAAASIFEPERRNERVAWAKTKVLLDIINSFTVANMQEFADNFTNPKCHDGKLWQIVLNALHKTLNQISSEALNAHGMNIYPQLHHVVSNSLF